MLGETDPRQQTGLLFKAGVHCLALRLGVSGSLVGTAERLHHVPSWPAIVVDETGWATPTVAALWWATSSPAATPWWPGNTVQSRRRSRWSSGGYHDLIQQIILI